MLNLLDFAMNILCSLQVMFVFVYSAYVEVEMKELEDDDAFVELSTILLLFDLLNAFQSLLYILMAVSEIKTLVFWLPGTFRIVVDLFGYLISCQTALIMICAMILSTLGNTFLSVTLGPYFLNFYRSDFLGVRSSVVIS